MKNVFLLLACCAFYFPANAQIKQIHLDFGKKFPPVINELDIATLVPTTKTFNDIKAGDYYQIVITDINLNLYKVQLSSADTNLSSRLETPSFGNFAIDNLSKVIGGISSLSTSVTVSSPFQEFTKSLGFIANDGDFPRVLVIANSEIVKRMKDEKDTLSSIKTDLETIATKIDAMKMEVYKLRLDALTVGGTLTYNFASALIEIEKARKQILDLKVRMEIAKSSYLTYSENNNSAIETEDDLKKNDRAIKEAYEKLGSTLLEALSSVSADKANELLSTILFLSNPKGTYTSLPIQFTKEQARVEVTITPRDEKFNLNTFKTSITFPLNIKKYNVIGLSFYGATLYDKSYSTIKTLDITKTDTTASYSFKEEKGNEKAELGIAALLKYGRKWNSANTFGGHFSFGTGISISNKIKPRILFGGGLAFGKKHMFVTDFGGIVGYEDRKSVVIDLSKSYPEKPESVVVSKIGFGLFFSAGYVYQF